MTNPLHAAHYADQLKQATAEVIQNVEIARDTYRLRFRCPAMAVRVKPGQFLMVRLSHFNDPLIGRPFALYEILPDDSGDPSQIDVVYVKKGKLTSRLAEVEAGHTVDVWGPLGNGFSLRPTAHLVMVAGGIGQTPFLALGQYYLQSKSYGELSPIASRAERVTLCYGARTADYLAGVSDFRSAGFDVRIATDDGSMGHPGLVTELLEQTLADAGPDVHVVCCGPEPMMQAAAAIADRRAVSCEVSLETPMACGIGICFTCVAKVKDTEGHWDYKRTCVEGPVFDATKIVW